MTKNNQQNQKSRKELRFEREEAALRKNLLKRKKQQELINKKNKEAKNG
jgi:hypothetical protein